MDILDLFIALEHFFFDVFCPTQVVIAGVTMNVTSILVWCVLVGLLLRLLKGLAK